MRGVLERSVAASQRRVPERQSISEPSYCIGTKSFEKDEGINVRYEGEGGIKVVREPCDEVKCKIKSFNDKTVNDSRLWSVRPNLCLAR